MATSYPRRDTASGIWKLSEITKNIKTEGTWPGSTRGLSAGGTVAPAVSTTVDYITVEVTGNATDFGDLTAARNQLSGRSSFTRAVMAGGAAPGVVNVIDYVTIADANFVVFTDRDMEVTEKLVDLQKQYGYPKVVDATWYKNSSDEILEIVKKFISSGFNRGLTLSVQSMDFDVLDEIKRRNMEMSDLAMIFDKCNKENIPSYTELILGLPKEMMSSSPEEAAFFHLFS